jgi:magnesium chelatase family protein
MAVSVVYTRAHLGLEAPLVTIETHLTNGVPQLAIVGLPETAVKESKDRVRSALLNSGFEFPLKRITINLAPADLPKEGAQFDLAIALSILIASQQIHIPNLSDKEFLGELALTGELRPVKGILPMAIACQRDGKKLFIPLENAKDACIVQNLMLYGAHDLLSLTQALQTGELSPYQGKTIQCTQKNLGNFSEVKGQHFAKRALEIAAAGAHSALLVGPPGCGKSMLASRFSSILPPLSQLERLEVAMINSITQSGNTSQVSRPFRSPHHNASHVAIVGGGSKARPGEITLAHHGVLFLDELPEFDRRVLESLREPLETGQVHVSRANYSHAYPARFQFLAAMNPCPCGYLSDTTRRCRCTPDQIQRYRNKISGPILDRIDVQVDLPALNPNVLKASSETIESSETIQQRVIAARETQLSRQFCYNSNLSPKQIDTICDISPKTYSFFEKAMTTLKFSARSYHRILKIARTIADLDLRDQIEINHLQEAIGYRQLDRLFS